MCFFSIKFQGRRYYPGAAVALLKYQQEQINEQKDIAEAQARQLAAAQSEIDDLAQRLSLSEEVAKNLLNKNRILRNANTQIKSVNAKLRKELKGFPARSESGKYVKRTKKNETPKTE